VLVVDQPASIGALPLAVARDMGCPIAYLPGLTMRRIANFYSGEAKTDARDVFIIAGVDDDLAGEEATRVANRLHGLLTQIHSTLERVLGPRLQHPAVLALIQRFGSPAQIRKASRQRLVTLLRPQAPRMAERLVDEIFVALDEQTVRVPGTEAVALIVPSLAASLTAVLDQRKLLAGRIEELLEAHPLEAPDVHAGSRRQDWSPHPDRGRQRQSFPTADHLAAYAGLAPATRSSGSSIRGEQPSRRGNKQLNRAFSLSAFAAMSDPPSRAYYDKKIAQGHHTQAPLCLARCRADVLSPCSATEPSTTPTGGAQESCPVLGRQPEQACASCC
jgi:transposase